MLGAEVATGAVSLAAARLWTGLVALLRGQEAVISAPRYVSGVALLLAGVGLYAAMLWAERQRGTMVADGSRCPNCGSATKRVRRRKRHRLLSRMLETNVQRRRCERCGWSGLAS